MTRNVISIDDRGSVSVPKGKIMMRDCEIAELFEVMVPTVKGKIKTLLKNRHFNGCTYKPEFWITSSFSIFLTFHNASWQDLFNLPPSIPYVKKDS